MGGITGFRIFHGIAPGAYGEPTVVSDPNAREFEMGLSPGTHYFAVAPLTESGVIGVLSNEVSKVVQ